MRLPFEHVSGDELLCFVFMVLGVVDEVHGHGIYLGVFNNSVFIIGWSINSYLDTVTCLFLVVENEICCVL
jgi:hypothetical protein